MTNTTGRWGRSAGWSGIAARLHGGLSIGDGVEPPEASTFVPGSDDAAVIETPDGPTKFTETIAWYTGAMTRAIAA